MRHRNKYRNPIEGRHGSISRTRAGDLDARVRPRARPEPGRGPARLCPVGCERPDLVRRGPATGRHGRRPRLGRDDRAKSLDILRKQLLENEAGINTPLAVIEQATTKYQKVHISTIGKCTDDFKDVEFSSPALIIVGEVVALHQKFQWFTTNGAGSVFKDLSLIK